MRDVRKCDVFGACVGEECVSGEGAYVGEECVSGEGAYVGVC